jgi:hypothetical protein
MVDHQSDISKVEIPENAPGDYGEIFDYILHEGPVAYQDIYDNTPFMSTDEVHSALEWIQENGFATNTEKLVSRGKWYIPVEE